MKVEEEQTLDTSKAKNAMAALAAAQQASREEQRRRWVSDRLRLYLQVHGRWYCAVAVAHSTARC
jgi:hypothetical protein